MPEPTSMDPCERFTSWKNAAVDALRAAGRDDAEDLERMVWTKEEDLFGFFDCFRPDGRGLGRVFAGVVGGDQILPRLLRVYESTKGSEGAYFVVRRPAPVTDERLIKLTTQHLDKVWQIAVSAGEVELARLLSEPPAIEIQRSPPPDLTMPDYNAPETALYDIVGDWFRSLEPVTSDARFLREALYSIACDYNLARYVMWPLYQDRTGIEEPFAPYCDLWTYGARPWFGRPGLVTVYAGSG